MDKQKIRDLYRELGGVALKERRAKIATYLARGWYDRDEDDRKAGEAKLAALLRGEGVSISLEKLRAPLIPVGEPDRRKRQRVRDKAMRYKARAVTKLDDDLDQIIGEIALRIAPAGETFGTYVPKVLDALRPEPEPEPEVAS